jgi:hypothetical protein
MRRVGPAVRSVAALRETPSDASARRFRCGGISPADQPCTDQMFISPAYAQTAGGAAEAGGFASLISFAPLLLIFIVF